MRFQNLDFMSFIILFLVVTISSYTLAVNYAIEGIFVGFYAFSIGIFIICLFIYIYPLAMNYIDHVHGSDVDPGLVLLRSPDGKGIVAKSRKLEDMIRRTEI